MHKTLGCVAAFSVLTLMLMGPLYFAFTTSHSDADTLRCQVGEIGCDTRDIANYKDDEYR